MRSRSADGSLATLSIQGQPDRAVALKRRETSELIAEELRRLDPDDTYASALRFGVDRLGGVTSGSVAGTSAVSVAASRAGASDAGLLADEAPGKGPSAAAAPVEEPTEDPVKEAAKAPATTATPAALAKKAATK